MERDMQSALLKWAREGNREHSVMVRMAARFRQSRARDPNAEATKHYPRHEQATVALDFPKAKGRVMSGGQCHVVRPNANLSRAGQAEPDFPSNVVETSAPGTG
jgi:hypothetical protein